MKQYSWNPWHGCYKKSEGCLNCYVYRHDARYNQDASRIYQTQNFKMPIQRNRNKEYKIPSGALIATCFTSDFFLETADQWRKEVWDMIRERRDCRFSFLTKRIERFYKELPHDWRNGWENVEIGCSCENQKRVDERIPILLQLPIKTKQIICAPLLEEISLEKYLDLGIDLVVVSGESGNEARVCDFNWVKKLQEECVKHNVCFVYRQTGARLLKDGKIYRIKTEEQSTQAKKAHLDYQHQSLI